MMASFIRLLPNALGVFRLLAAPVVLLLFALDRTGDAIWLFLIAGSTDAIDGVIARRFGVVTKFGQYLDPIADKALINAMALSLALKAVVPLWLAGLILARDLLILATAILVAWRDMTYDLMPLIIGKISTFVQLVGLSAIALIWQGWMDGQVALATLVMIIAVMTILSALGYLHDFVRWLLRPSGA